jgi:hypothetical protein
MPQLLGYGKNYNRIPLCNITQLEQDYNEYEINNEINDNYDDKKISILEFFNLKKDNPQYVVSYFLTKKLNNMYHSHETINFNNNKERFFENLEILANNTNEKLHNIENIIVFNNGTSNNNLNLNALNNEIIFACNYFPLWIIKKKLSLKITCYHLCNTMQFLLFIYQSINILDEILSTFDVLILHSGILHEIEKNRTILKFYIPYVKRFIKNLENKNKKLYVLFSKCETEFKLKKIDFFKKFVDNNFKLDMDYIVTPYTCFQSGWEIPIILSNFMPIQKIYMCGSDIPYNLSHCWASNDCEGRYFSCFLSTFYENEKQSYIKYIERNISNLINYQENTNSEILNLNQIESVFIFPKVNLTFDMNKEDINIFKNKKLENIVKEKSIYCIKKKPIIISNPLSLKEEDDNLINLSNKLNLDNKLILYISSSFNEVLINPYAYHAHYLEKSNNLIYINAALRTNLDIVHDVAVKQNYEYVHFNEELSDKKSPNFKKKFNEFISDNKIIAEYWSPRLYEVVLNTNDNNDLLASKSFDNYFFDIDYDVIFFDNNIYSPYIQQFLHHQNKNMKVIIYLKIDDKNINLNMPNTDDILNSFSEPGWIQAIQNDNFWNSRYINQYFCMHCSYKNNINNNKCTHCGKEQDHNHSDYFDDFHIFSKCKVLENKRFWSLINNPQYKTEFKNYFTFLKNIDIYHSIAHNGHIYILGDYII